MFNRSDIEMSARSRRKDSVRPMSPLEHVVAWTLLAVVVVLVF